MELSLCLDQKCARRKDGTRAGYGWNRIESTRIAVVRRRGLPVYGGFSVADGNESFRVTPAAEAGLSEHVLTVKERTRLLDKGLKSSGLTGWSFFSRLILSPNLTLFGVLVRCHSETYS
jgi:hypothetical protein